MVKLKTGKTGVCVNEMKDGDIAVITMWPISSYVGRVVQRYGDYLIAVGGDLDRGFGKYFYSHYDPSNSLVRILEPGDELIVR